VGEMSCGKEEFISACIFLNNCTNPHKRKSASPGGYKERKGKRR